MPSFPIGRKQRPDHSWSLIFGIIGGVNLLRPTISFGRVARGSQQLKPQFQLRKFWSWKTPEVEDSNHQSDKGELPAHTVVDPLQMPTIWSEICNFLTEGSTPRSMEIQKVQSFEPLIHGCWNGDSRFATVIWTDIPGLELSCLYFLVLQNEFLCFKGQGFN